MAHDLRVRRRFPVLTGFVEVRLPSFDNANELWTLVHQPFVGSTNDTKSTETRSQHQLLHKPVDIPQRRWASATLIHLGRFMLEQYQIIFDN